MLRSYANLANEMQDAGYTLEEVKSIKAEVIHYDKVREEVKIRSGDHLDMKQYEPAMRHLIDTYIRAEDSKVVADFEKLGLIEMIVQQGVGALNQLPASMQSGQEAMAETIENNIRKVIIDEQSVNPRYYEEMSELLDALIAERRKQAVDYKKYLEKVKDLCTKVVNPGGIDAAKYPPDIDTTPLKALYDNAGNDEELALRIDNAILTTKRADWVGSRLKERQVRGAVVDACKGANIDLSLIHISEPTRPY